MRPPGINLADCKASVKRDSHFVRLPFCSADAMCVAILLQASPQLSSPFREYLWLAAADIFGTVVGVGSAIAAFALVIWSYEKSLPAPGNSPPPSDDEIKHVVALANTHIGGEEE